MDRRLIRDGRSWDEMRAAFRWEIPQDFSMADACCDSWARQEPGRLAVTHVREDGGLVQLSFGQLKSASDRLANAFRAAGVGRGDRVAIFLPQCPEALIAHFAAFKLGAVTLPLFTLFGPDAVEFRLADSGARAVVTDSENSDKLQEIRGRLPELSAIYVTGPAAPPLLSFWDQIDRAAADLRPAPLRADDPAVLIYTSGTTGAPKGALHAHRFLLGHLPSIELHHEGFPRAGDIAWTPADWAWIGGLMDLAMPALFYGVPLISHRMRRFDPDAAYALIRDHSIRTLFMPPTALRLMRQATVPDGVSVRSVGSGGESLGEDLLEWGRSALGAPINEFYGQTECNLVLTSAAGSMEVRPGSMGRAVPGHEVAIIDGAGRVLPPGEVGEIAVRRPDPVMFLGYWNLPDKTREKFIGDWLRTGDLGRCDEGGYFTYVSRDDDVITSAGYRIGPTEIETCIAGHPDVVVAAVVGVPDPVRTEIVKAFVVLRDGADAAGLEAVLVQRVRDRVSPHVAPRLVEFVSELPMTATGKIMRRQLRDRG